MIKLFLKYGAKLNIKNYQKENICNEIITYTKPNMKIIKLLLKNKGNFNQPCSYLKVTPFHTLCKIQSLDLEIIRDCLNNGANPSKKDYEKKTPFQTFCFSNININLEIMELFLKKGAKINTKNSCKESAFTYLCQNKKAPIEVIKYYLTKKKAKYKSFGYLKQNILHVLCKNAKIDQEILTFFIKNNVNIKQLDYADKTPFHYLLQTKCKLHLENIKLFIDNGLDIDAKAHQDKESPFLLLCQHRHSYELYKSIFDLNVVKGINTTDIYGNTPFHYICRRHTDIRIFKLFLKNGARMDICNGDNEIPGYEFFTKNCSIEIFQLLLDNGMDINHVNRYNKSLLDRYCLNTVLDFDILCHFFKNGVTIKNEKYLTETPLHRICSIENNLNIEILQLFFENGFNINVLDKQRNTPFHLYCKRKNINFKIIECFLKYNHDKKLKDGNGRTVLDLLLYHSEVDTNRTIKVFKINFNTLRTDFKKFYTRKEFTDFEIKEIKVHKTLIEIRTKQKIEKIQEILEKYSKKAIKQFLKWIYFEKIPNGANSNQIEKSEENENSNKFENFKSICTELKIDYKSKDFSLSQSLRNLYENENLKDFIIILKDNQKIKVNKLILQCRSELYRGMFLNVEDSEKLEKINDYSGKSIEIFKILLYYLYTESIDKKIKITDNIKYELNEAVNYFQLDQNCSLNYLLSD